ncbi:MAG: glycosyltransferase family 2 protein, partial [Pseudonocardia sp.]|nr:glycosyltransferase family 2 protein [Pseudonocardia sp.]
MPDVVDGPARVTVIMPLKDPHPDFIVDAMQSIATQSSPRWRLLVVVEPEDVGAIGQQLARWTADERTRVIANEGVRLAGAVNTGMRRA